MLVTGVVSAARSHPPSTRLVDDLLGPIASLIGVAPTYADRSRYHANDYRRRAQENTLLTCRGLIDDFGDDVLLVTGPSTGPEGELLRGADAVKVPVAVVPGLRRAIVPWDDLRAYRQLRRTVQAFDPQVVHTHSAKAGFLGRLVAARLQVPAVVHTVHGAPFHEYQGRGARTLFRWCETYAARRCHAMVSVADAMTERLVAAGVAPREKFTTVYSGMNVQPFLESAIHRDATRRQMGFEPEHIVVGKIARLFHLKGHDDIVRSAEQVVQQCPQVRFLFVGDGILRHELETRIANAGLTDYFRFAGLVAPQEIPALLSAMDILVHASLREGLARALPQALLAGKPVVSYDIDGAREVVIPGETGFLTPPRDVAAVTNALTELAADSALRERLGSQGRALCCGVFSATEMTRQLRVLYQRVLDGTCDEPGSKTP